MTGYRYVVEITAAVDSSGTEQTFYVGSTGFTTRPTDTPAGTAIPPHLLNPGNYERSLFTGKRTFGAVSGNYGEVVIANHQGQYDGWIDYGFDGRRFRMYYGPEDAAYPSGYTLVLQCTMLSADFGLDAVRIKLRDRLSLLDKPVIGQTFAGTGGVEGSADLAGAPAALAGRHVFYSAGPAGSRAATVFRSPERAIYAGVHAHSVRRRRRADARQQLQQCF